jgi:hypothetical protein
MPKRKSKSDQSERLQQLLEEHKRYKENEPHRQRQLNEAKRQIDMQMWNYPLTFTFNDMNGKMVCVYDQIPTIEAVIETLKPLEGYKNKIDKSSYGSRISTLINFVFWQKMRDSLEELTWELSELIMHEDIFEDFSAYEALAGRQRIPLVFLI